jgi:hypothetical protein
MPGAHTVVVHELLVRYLDAWTARAAHSARAVAYAQFSAGTEATAGVDDAAGAALAALRVFGEFADRASGRLTVSVTVADDDAVERVRAALTAGAREAGVAPDVVRLDVSAGSDVVLDKGAHVFAYLDQRGQRPTTVPAARRGLEVLVRGPAAALDRWEWRATVELVGRDGGAETLSFGASDERALGVFKDELWALDEYAGIRYRDPGDPEGTLLDISLRPQLGPLRRLLSAQLGDEPVTFAQLRDWAVAHTIFRADDVTRAVTDLCHSGSVERTPAGGRLGAATELRLAS